ncbi:MAG TPA: glutamate--tRNA ligase [Rugosimonospora sp.]
MTVRVRFAPSPTGMFHVGGARSALQNWIFAKQHRGAFVLRIEDTDAARNRPEWTEGILSALDWIGITRGTYEGPYFQSTNADEHRSAAARLYESGQAYYCDCTREQIQARTNNQHVGYDGFCRDRSLGPGPGRALRFRTPDSGSTTIVDLIRGEPVFENRLIEDFVIARSDGSPVFLLANVVDDRLMGITHVIRAEEHLPNTPKQQLLWQALGAAPPIWAHVPVVVNEKRQKLSKRRDKVALEAYRDEGYLADAMRNYLMLLGWSPRGDREIVPWSVIEEEFRLEEVNPSPAFFDEKKLRAFNGEYIRALPVEEFIAACQPWLTGTDTIPAPPWPPERFDPKAFAALAPLAQTRVAVLSEIVANVDFLFLDRPDRDEAAWDKALRGAGDAAGALLSEAIAAFETVPVWEAASLKTTLEEIGARYGLKLGKSQAPVRVAVTGRSVGLPLFESLEVLGRDRTLERLRDAAGSLDTAR